MNDEQILELYFRRDEDAITQSRNQYGAYCTKIAMSILNDPQDSEECFSDALFAAWRSIPPKRPARLATYLGRITRNLAINRWQQDHAQKRAAGEFALSLDELDECVGTDAPDADGLSGLADAINRFLLGQKMLDRQVFVCRYYYFDSIADISRHFAISQSKVKSQLHRMRARLKSYLESEGIHV